MIYKNGVYIPPLDNTPVDDETEEGITSDWAYEHEAAADPHTGYIKHSLATAVSDFLAASGAGVFVKKTLAEVKTILGLGTAAYTAATAYVTHALATAANDFLVASGSGAYIKKTLAEVKTILGITNVEDTAHSTDAHTMTIDGVDVSAHDANTTTAHGAVSAATASKHVVRDASARAKFAAPGASGDALIKGTRVTADELPAVTDEYYLVGTGANMEERAVPAAGVATKEIFASAHGRDSWYLDMGGPLLNGVGESGHCNILIPADFTSLTSIEAILSPTVTGASMYIDILTRWGSKDGGETWFAHTETQAAINLGATITNNYLPLDISGWVDVAPLAVGDILVVRFLYNATIVATNCYFKGIRFKYS